MGGEGKERAGEGTQRATRAKINAELPKFCGPMPAFNSMGGELSGIMGSYNLTGGPNLWMPRVEPNAAGAGATFQVQTGMHQRCTKY